VTYGWLVVGQSVVAGLAYGLWAAVCDMDSAAAAAACGTIQVLHAFALCLTGNNNNTTIYKAL